MRDKSNQRVGLSVSQSVSRLVGRLVGRLAFCQARPFLSSLFFDRFAYQSVSLCQSVHPFLYLFVCVSLS